MIQGDGHSPVCQILLQMMSDVDDDDDDDDE